MGSAEPDRRSHERGALDRALELFLPRGANLGEDRRERAAMVAGVCVTIAAMLVPFIGVSWWVYGGPNVTSFGAVGVLAAMIGIGVLLRATGRVRLAGTLVPAVILVVLAAVGFRRGGLGAVNLICYPFVPLVAGFLVGRRAAVAAAAAVAAVMAGFWALHHAGHPFPSGTSGPQHDLIAAVGTSLMALVVLGIVLLYEEARARARRVTAESLAELRRRGVELEEARAKAEAASRAKGEFLARVSHELRTPLNGVMGMTELLLGSGLTAEQRDFARDSRRSATALLALVNDLLDFTKLESGTVELSRQGLDPRDPAEDAVGVLAGAAQRKGIELVCSVDGSVPRWLRGDPDRLRQVLLNLVGNGVKYTDAGRVVLRVSRPKPKGPVRFEVTDTGRGLPEGPTATLFEPFSQADPAANFKLGGVGLGLAICKQLVHRMGGRIGAEPAPSGGARFWFTLPVSAAEGAPPAPPRLALDGRRILVVDDDGEAARAAAALLEAQGADVAVFDTVDAALAEGHARPPDLIVADTVMPERAAMDLLRDLAADPALRRTPVLLCVPYGFSFDLSGLSGVRTGRVRKPLFELALLTAAAPLLGLRPPDAPPDPAVADSGANFLPVHGDGARVLVVDDNDVGRRLARELLARLGFSVQDAADGREARRRNGIS